ncbi:hypothetical protein CAPTEDRAFT_217828 [Capitella teleta]|uniref:LRRCT domain-containing protein n=1 Tax=Capitella teleta TaxID=283909 RepID=R7VGL5_CAPTE|nr:hypothetical protein CAPTEDRAFT_217828 [Capitella teleta]|eukprot:ELU17687.1 hypothetical protein CAPTEDRAFT_217828 [Capitella teleta]
MVLDIEFAVFVIGCVLSIAVECEDDIQYSFAGKGLTEIPQDIPQDVAHIHLNSNSITTIGANAFSNFSELVWLDMNSNKIDVIHDDAFSGLYKLSFLNLRGNRLQEVPKLEGLTLSDLILEQNKIQLKEEDFENATIKFLLINNNQINGNLSAISNLADSLLELYINNNPLGKSSPAELYNLIKSLTKATWINMEYCGITSIPDVRPIPRITFGLIGNPFSCDCRISWTSEVPINYYDGFRCVSQPSDSLYEALCPVRHWMRTCSSLTVRMGQEVFPFMSLCRR